MLNLQIKHNFQSGFTLLEIMLVLVVIGMASVGVMMAMPQHINKNDDVDWQAQRFATLLQFAEDEALISGKEFAIVFDDHRYRFSRYDYDTKKWLAAASEQLSPEIEIPASIEFSYTLLGSVWDEIETQDNDIFIDDSYLVEVDEEDKVESYSPQVFIMSSGQVTPFSVQFTQKEGSNSRNSTIEVNMSGEVTHLKPSVQ